MVVEVFLHLAQVLLHSALYVAVDVGLLTALVVGIGVVRAVACRPLVVVGPAVGVVDVALLRVNFVECHQAFVVNGSCPEVARPHLVYIGVASRVVILLHEVIVGAIYHIQYFLLFRGLRRCL